MKLFVYGTLMKGEGNHHLMKSAEGKFIRTATTSPLFDLYNLGSFPALVAKGDTGVRGEVWEVAEEMVSILDRLEGHPHFYRREPIQLEWEELNGEEVWAYLLPWKFLENSSHKDIIVSGNWRERKQ